MSMKTKFWLLGATALILIGGVLFGGVMMMLRWDFSKLSMANMETNTYEVAEAFGSILINSDTADLVFLPAEDGQCRVVCYEAANERNTVAVTEGVLTIRTVNEKKWYDYIGIHAGKPKITVYLPAAEYEALTIREDTGNIVLPGDFTLGRLDISVGTGDATCRASVLETMNIKTSTGKIHVENVSAGAMALTASTGGVTVSDVRCGGDVQISVSTGKVKLTALSCNNLETTGNTGDISMEQVMVSQRLTVQRTTGGVRFDGCDAGEIQVTTGTGDVTGTLLTQKVFIAHTNTGRVEVPETTAGGTCKITTNTGNIKISIR